MMTDEQFDALWQRAEGEEHAKRLSEQYPAWRAKQRRTAGATLMMAVLLAIVVPAVRVEAGHENGALVVCCNRAGTSDQQWVDLAAEMLLES